MPTSGTVAFNPTITQVVYGALRMVGAYASTDMPRAEQVVDAKEALDMMLKAWQMDGALWLKDDLYVTLVAAQSTYTIGPGSADTVTTDAAGAVPYSQRPTRIYQPRRRNKATGYEVSLGDAMSRQEYASVTSKAAQGSPTQVYFLPELAVATLAVWPVPADATEQIVFTIDRIIEDVGDGDNTFDIPPEWSETVKWNLAFRLLPEYPGGDSARIEKYAMAMKEKMDGFQRSGESTFFQPAYQAR
jgi:hypothetical protein